MCAAGRTCKLRPPSDFLLEIRRGSQFMRSVGLEPTRLAAQEPKSCMSANFIMTAYIVLFSYSALTLTLSLLLLYFYSALTLLLLCFYSAFTLLSEMPSNAASKAKRRVLMINKNAVKSTLVDLQRSCSH